MFKTVLVGWFFIYFYGKKKSYGSDLELFFWGKIIGLSMIAVSRNFFWQKLKTHQFWSRVVQFFLINGSCSNGSRELSVLGLGRGRFWVILGGRFQS